MPIARIHRVRRNCNTKDKTRRGRRREEWRGGGGIEERNSTRPDARHILINVQTSSETDDPELRAIRWPFSHRGAASGWQEARLSPHSPRLDTRNDLSHTDRVWMSTYGTSREDIIWHGFSGFSVDTIRIEPINSLLCHISHSTKWSTFNKCFIRFFVRISIIVSALRYQDVMQISIKKVDRKSSLITTRSSNFSNWSREICILNCINMYIKFGQNRRYIVINLRTRSYYCQSLSIENRICQVIDMYISRLSRDISVPWKPQNSGSISCEILHYTTWYNVNGFYRAGLYNLEQQTSRTIELVLSVDSCRESIVYLFLEQRSAEINIHSISFTTPNLYH